VCLAFPTERYPFWLVLRTLPFTLFLKTLFSGIRRGEMEAGRGGGDQLPAR
jgi:hypothetical protein